MKPTELRQYLKKDIVVHFEDGKEKIGKLKNYNSKTFFLLEESEEETTLQHYPIVDIASVKLAE